MSRKTAHDFDQELLILFDAYVHGAIDRRAFLDKAAKFAVGGVTAAMLLDQLSPAFRRGPGGEDRRRADQDDIPRVRLAQGQRQGARLLRQPAKADGQAAGRSSSSTRTAGSTRTSRTSRGAWRSTTSWPSPRTRCFRWAAIPGDEDKARELFQKLDQAKTREDFVAAAAFLKARPECTGKIGAVGFCYGGGMVNYLATRLGSDLAAGVRFYGSAPNAEDVAKIKAPLMVQSAENDERINASWPEFERALKAANVKYERFLYPGTQHGFNNDTTPRYDAAAAKLAWERTIAFFNKHLR